MYVVPIYILTYWTQFPVVPFVTISVIFVMLLAHPFGKLLHQGKPPELASDNLLLASEIIENYHYCSLLYPPIIYFSLSLVINDNAYNGHMIIQITLKIDNFENCDNFKNYDNFR